EGGDWLGGFCPGGRARPRLFGGDLSFEVVGELARDLVRDAANDAAGTAVLRHRAAESERGVDLHAASAHDLLESKPDLGVGSAAAFFVGAAGAGPYGQGLGVDFFERDRAIEAETHRPQPYADFAFV